MSVKSARTKAGDAVTPDVLRRLQQGDEKAFCVVFTKYYAAVKNFLRAFTESVEDAEEICQEVFVNIWKFRSKIDPQRDVTPLIYVVVKNELADYLKAKHQIESCDLDEWTDEGVGSSDTGLIVQETELLVDLVVSRMPRRRKECYILSRVNGLNNDAIAERLFISKHAVENNLYMALKEIRKVISLFIVFVI